MHNESRTHRSCSASERHPRLTPITCVLMAAHILLLLCAESVPSHEFLFLFFFSSMVILPGLIAAMILFPASGSYAKLLFSIILGIVPMFVLLTIVSVLALDIMYIPWIMPLLCIGLAIYHDRRRHGGSGFPDNRALSRPIVIIMITILAIVSIITLVVRDPISYTADSPDHMAYIRAVTRSHEVFPNRFIYSDGGMLTRDIRRGLLHAMWGTINAATSRTDVLPVWPFISWIGSIFLLLGIFFLGVQLFGSQSIGIGGVILYLLFYQRGFAGHQLFTNAYGFYFAKIYLFSFLACVILYVRTARRDLLFMAVLSSFAAIGTHISYIMILLFIVCILWIVEWLQYGDKIRVRELTGRIIRLIGLVIAVNLPYLFLRYIKDYNPVNEIHTHPQGMLFFGDKLAVINPIIFYQQSGPLMIVALFAVFILWRQSRGDRNLRSVLCLVAAVYILSFNPLFVPFIMDKITYLIVRFSVAAPSMLVVAYLIRDVLLGSRKEELSRTRMILGSIIVLVLLVPGLALNITDFAHAGRDRHISERKSCLALADLYSFVNRSIPAGSVIASDPITSYALLAFTDQYVVCTYDQHSTPNDSTAIRRMYACRDIFLPGATCGGRSRALDEYGARYVVVNGRIPTIVRSQYWRPDRASAETTAFELSRCEASFESLYSAESLYLFAYTGAPDDVGAVDAEETGEGPERPPFQVSEFVGDFGQLTESGTDGIYIENYGQDAEKVSRGDTLGIFIDWVASERMEPGTYIVYVRFDAEFEKGALYRSRYGKIYRKALERIRGETYRCRYDALPFEGIYPPDKWIPRQVLRDHIRVPVPGYISKGVYTISVKMDNAPHYSNLRMKDLLRDDDFYDGPDLMEIRIE